MASEPRRRGRWCAVDGVLLLDKPVGPTSNAALQTARRLHRAAKAGHTGTLDPLASGLLPVLFGEATKFSGFLLDADKSYRARVQLGSRTTTGDAEGDVVERCKVAVDAAAIEAVLDRFRGEIEQVPPMHSALKREGRPLYAYARAGLEVERRARHVTIRELAWHDFADEAFTLEVRCSKGTYVRSLAADIGAALGCGAHLAALRRTAIGRFDVSEAFSLAQLEGLGDAERLAALRPVDSLLADFPEVHLEQAGAQALAHGRDVHGFGGLSGLVRAYGPGGAFLGLAEALSGGPLRAKRLLATQDTREDQLEPCAEG